MSLLKTGAVQVGQSGTASNNFHWRNLLDGLLRLSRGNAGSLPAGDNAADVMRVKADNSVEFPSGVADGVLGAGQTEQAFTIGTARINGTTYTNTTGRPIEVTIGFASGSSISFTVNGMIKISGTTAASVFFCTSFIVPSGATYSATGAFVWTELR